MKTTALALMLLTANERTALEAARPGSRSIVWRNLSTVPATLDPLDEPLPEGFVPAPFIPYVSNLDALTPAEDAAARAEGEAEAAPLVLAIETETATEAARLLAAREAEANAALPANIAPAPIKRPFLHKLPLPVFPRVPAGYIVNDPAEALRLAVLNLPGSARVRA